MSVVIETTLGDITVDLYLKERPRACLNFLKLCKIKYYNYSLFHTISRDFIAQTGDPTGSRTGGESIFGVMEGPLKRYFEAETTPRIKHTVPGLISFVGNEDGMIGSQFFITLAPDLTYLDAQHCVFGEVVEGQDVLELLNEVICDGDNRPYQDVRITHTVILDDPLPDPKALRAPERSPSPSAERLQGGRIAPDEEIDETAGKSLDEINELIAEREAKARATILEMVGDIPDVDVAPPENVLFVCKLNPVTTDDDLEIIFSRFGKIKSCEVIRDKKTGDSLQYAFVEFEEQKSCEDAYFKMDNVLIDDRRIHVDFSQSVAKVKWHGKGRGVTHYDERGRKTERGDRGIGKGDYKERRGGNHQNGGPRRDFSDRKRGGDGDRARRGRSRSKSSDRRNKRANDVEESERRSSRRGRSNDRARDGNRNRERYYYEGRHNEKPIRRRKDTGERSRIRSRSRSREVKRSGRDYGSSRGSERRREGSNEDARVGRRSKSRSRDGRVAMDGEGSSEKRNRRREISAERSTKREDKRTKRKQDGSSESDVNEDVNRKRNDVRRGEKQRRNRGDSSSDDNKKKKRKKTKSRKHRSSSSSESSSEESSESSSSSEDKKKMKSNKKRTKQKKKKHDSSSD